MKQYNNLPGWYSRTQRSVRNQLLRADYMNIARI